MGKFLFSSHYCNTVVGSLGDQVVSTRLTAVCAQNRLTFLPWHGRGCFEKPQCPHDWQKTCGSGQNPKQGWDWHDESFSRPSNNKTKKKRILADIESLNKTADKLAEKAERTGQIPLITQSNSLRKTAKAKDVELKDLGQKLEDKMQSIKDL